MLSLACGSSSGADGGSAISDLGQASPGVCVPSPGQSGNAMNVGAYCSPGGNQCSQYAHAQICAIDVEPDNGGKFCIKIGCNTNDECGAGACCTGNGGAIHACVPSGCVADDAGACPPIPEPDAASPDSALGDTSAAG
jgi:hypothetical protein